jgi:hypothetical protein
MDVNNSQSLSHCFLHSHHGAFPAPHSAKKPSRRSQTPSPGPCPQFLLRRSMLGSKAFASKNKHFRSPNVSALCPHPTQQASLFAFVLLQTGWRRLHISQTHPTFPALCRWPSRAETSWRRTTPRQTSWRRHIQTGSHAASPKPSSALASLWGPTPNGLPPRRPLRRRRSSPPPCEPPSSHPCH